MTRRLDWTEFRTGEFAAIDPMQTIALLPLAAVEQHGPHLPAGTDTIIAEGMLAQLRADLPGDLDLRILPVQAVGKSNEHLFAPGTLTLSAETAIRAWSEIALSVARAGCRKIFMVTSHGGNAAIMDIAAREARVAAGMLAVKCSWGSFGFPEGMYSDFELACGLHGGDVETSLMLAFAPHTVDLARAARFGMRETPIPATGPVSYGWIASDLNPEGVAGDAHLATAAKGRATAQHQAGGLIAALRRLRDMELPAHPA